MRAADDGSKDIIQAEEDSQGAVFVVWGGGGDGFAGSPSTYAAR